MIVGKIGETTYDKQMLLALIIGVVHICIAMLVRLSADSTIRFQGVVERMGMVVACGRFYCYGRPVIFQGHFRRRVNMGIYCDRWNFGYWHLSVE